MKITETTKRECCMVRDLRPLNDIAGPSFMFCVHCGRHFEEMLSSPIHASLDGRHFRKIPWPWEAKKATDTPRCPSCLAPGILAPPTDVDGAGNPKPIYRCSSCPTRWVNVSPTPITLTCRKCGGIKINPGRQGLCGCTTKHSPLTPPK